jgi:hypothetical protein
MATQLQIRRGTSTQVAAFTGAEGEIVVNTTNDSVHVNDGSTQGGFELARIDGSNWAITNAISTTNNISFGDNDKAIFGAGSDLEILSNGTDGLIRNGNATGEIRMESDDRIIIADRGFNEVFAVFNDDDDVKLYHNGSQKLATTATGIKVTDRVDIGSVGAGTASATPVELNLGSTFADSAGSLSKAKLKLFEDSSANVYGLSVSTGLLEFGVPSSAGHAFYINESEKMRLTSTGLGIGTSSPDTLLELRGADPILTIRDSSTSSASGIATLRLAETGASDSLDQYFDIRANAGKLEIVDNWNEGGGTGTRVTLDDSGRVGIGTSSPGAALDINRATGTASYARVGNGGNVQAYIGVAGDNLPVLGSFTNHALRMVVNASEVARFDTSGNFGLNTSTPTSKKSSKTLQVNGNLALGDNNATGLIAFGDIASENANVAIFRGASGPYSATNGNSLNISAYEDVVFMTGNAEIASQNERARLNVNGSFLIGTATAFTSGSTNSGGSGALHIARDNERCLFLKRASSNGTVVEFFRGAVTNAVGSISITASATAFNTSSDRRLKENIADADDAGSKVDAIKVRQFDWKTDGSHQDYGMVAQELQSVAPEAVSGDADSEEMMGVDYSKLVPMLIKEIQALRARVAQLEDKE